MSYDRKFISDVFNTIEKYETRLKHYPEFVKNWFDEIKSYCEMVLHASSNETEFNYEISVDGEIVSDMICQYRYDEEFAKKALNIKLCQLVDARDIVIRNLRDQNHQSLHLQDHLLLP